MQQISLAAGATADTTGTATFTWLSIPPGQAWLVTVSVPLAIAGLSVLTCAGAQLGSWQGCAPAGPFYAAGGGSLELVVSNLVPGNTYQALAQGQQGSQAELPPQPPTASVGSVQATRTQQLVMSGSVPLQSTPQTEIITLSPNWRSLFVGGKTGNLLSSVIGQQSGMTYEPVVAEWSPRGTVTLLPAFVRYPLWNIDTTVSVFMINNKEAGDTFYIGADNDPTDIAVDANISQSLPVTPERSDGNPLPISSQLYSGNSSGASGTVLASPGAGLTYNLAGAQIRLGTMGGNGLVVATVTATVGGVTRDILSAGGGTGTASPTFSNPDRAVWPNGLVVDTATPIGFTSTTTGTATITSFEIILYYDTITPI
jgi:hypothetical protein